MIAAAAVTPPAPSGLWQFVQTNFELVVGGGLFTLLAAGLLYVSTRKRDQSDDLGKRFTASQEFEEYVDGRVERVAGPLREELDKLKRRELDNKIILHAYFQRLLWWAERGGYTNMPMLDEADLEKLGLDVSVFQDLTTETRAAVRDAVLRAAHSQQQQQEGTPS